MVLLQNGRNVSKKTKKRTGIGSVAEERGEKGAIASSRRSSQAASMKSQYCLSLFCLFISYLQNMKNEFEFSKHN